MAIRLRPHDLRRSVLIVEEEPGFGGVDLVRLESTGFLYLAYRQDAEIRVTRSRTQGSVFDITRTLASDAETEVGRESVPSLLADEDDTLYCWYHADGGGGRGYLSEDFGHSWSLYKSVAAPYYYPRIALAPGELFLVMNFATSDFLTLHYSDDRGVTLVPSGIIFGDPPTGGDPEVQRVVLFVDRHGTTHLIYRSVTGAIVHRASDNPVNLDHWTASAVLVGAGELPAAGGGLFSGLLTYFSGDTHVAALLRSDYAAIAASVPAPEGAAKAYGAVVYDAHDGPFWAGLKTTSSLGLQHTDHEGTAWTVLQ